MHYKIKIISISSTTNIKTIINDNLMICKNAFWNYDNKDTLMIGKINDIITKKTIFTFQKSAKISLLSCKEYIERGFEFVDNKKYKGGSVYDIISNHYELRGFKLYDKSKLKMVESYGYDIYSKEPVVYNFKIPYDSFNIIERKLIGDDYTNTLLDFNYWSEINCGECDKQCELCNVGKHCHVQNYGKMDFIILLTK